MATALFIGRFQPLHNGHLEVLKKLSQEYEKVIIGIGSPKGKGLDNPWDLEEREDMIKAVIKAESLKNIEIVPVPDFDSDEEWIDFIKENIEFDDVYSGNEWTKHIFDKAGCCICHLERIDNISSTEIREKIKNKESIKDLVPKEVLDFIGSS